MRNTWTFFTYFARCTECSWELSSKNALGLAAQHHDRTGHSIATDVEGHVDYLTDAEHAARIEERKK